MVAQKSLACRPQLIQPHGRSAITLGWYRYQIPVNKQLDKVLLFPVFWISCEEKGWCKMVVRVLKVLIVSTYAFDIMPGASHWTLASCRYPHACWVKARRFVSVEYLASAALYLSRTIIPSRMHRACVCRSEYNFVSDCCNMTVGTVCDPKVQHYVYI